MSRRITLLLVALGLLAFPSFAFGLGMDYPKGKIGASSWSEPLTELVNRDSRIHGYFVNFQDVLFYVGDCEELNAFVEAYAKLPDASRTIYLLPGRGTAVSPWTSSFRPTPCDWQLDLTGGHASLRIWVDGTVKLDDLKPPLAVSFSEFPEVADSPPEGRDAARAESVERIRKFIARHEAAQKAAADAAAKKDPAAAASAINQVHAKAAEDMPGKQVTVWLDNGTAVPGQLIEDTAEYVVLLMAAEGKKKLIYKAKITSIDWPAAGGSRMVEGPG